MSSKGDYKAFKPTIDRILGQARQEVDLGKKFSSNSPEYLRAIEKRGRDLAELEKRRLSMQFNLTTANVFYNLFEFDLRDFIEKMEKK